MGLFDDWRDFNHDGEVDHRERCMADMILEEDERLMQESCDVNAGSSFDDYDDDMESDDFDDDMDDDDFDGDMDDDEEEILKRELEMEGLDFDVLDLMDEDERIEELEMAGLDPDDYEDLFMGSGIAEEDEAQEDEEEQEEEEAENDFVKPTYNEDEPVRRGRTMYKKLAKKLKENTDVMEATFAKYNLKILQYVYEPYSDDEDDDDADCQLIMELASLDGGKMPDSAWIKVNLYDENDEIFYMNSWYMTDSFSGYDTILFKLYKGGKMLLIAKKARLYISEQ